MGCWPFTLRRLDFSLFSSPPPPCFSSVPRPRLSPPCPPSPHFYPFNLPNKGRVFAALVSTSEPVFGVALFSPKTLSDSNGSGRSRVLASPRWRERKNQRCRAAAGKHIHSGCTLLQSNQRRGGEEGEMLSPPALWVVRAVNIDYRLKAIRIMEQKKTKKNLASPCQNLSWLRCAAFQSEDSGESVRVGRPSDLKGCSVFPK